MTERPGVSVVVIAKNEERWIDACVRSALPFADEVLVVDTGSTDRTVEVARQAGARIGQFAWTGNFAEARNAAAAQATHDIVLALDADETLTGVPRRFRRLAADVVGRIRLVELTNLAADEWLVHSYGVDRLYDRRFGQYRGGVHEHVEPASGASVVKDPVDANVLAITHHGYQDPAVLPHKGRRNADAARLELASGDLMPGDRARILHDLGRSLALAGDWDEAVTALLDARAVPGAASQLRVRAADDAIRVLLLAGRANETADLLADLEAAGSAPGYVALRAAEVLIALDLHADALPLLERAVAAAELVDPSGRRLDARLPWLAVLAVATELRDRALLAQAADALARLAPSR